MIDVKKLAREEIITLSEMHKNHPLHLTRQRAHAVLLSHKGLSIPTLCCFYEVCRQTVSSWFTKWEKSGLTGLLDEAGRGRPKTIKESQEKAIIERVLESPRLSHKIFLDNFLYNSASNLT